MSQSEQTQEGDIKPNAIKNIPLPEKQNKNHSQNNEKFITKISAECFENF